MSTYLKFFQFFHKWQIKRNNEKDGRRGRKKRERKKTKEQEKKREIK